MKITDQVWNFGLDNPFYGTVVLFCILLAAWTIPLSISLLQRKHDFSLGIVLRDLIIITVISASVSLLGFGLSPSWVEYPLGGGIYTKNSMGEWLRHEGRIVHKPFGFEGETVDEHYLENFTITLYQNSPFTLKAHVARNDIPLLLKNMNQGGYGGLGSSTGGSGLNKFCQAKSYQLFFITPLKDLNDDSTRLRLFKEHYAPFGITIDSVDFP